MRFLMLILISFFVMQTSAQVKNETERRIRKKDVPEEVMGWFKDAYEKKKKVKWFYQTDGEKKVYEAKLNYKQQKHSVEILPSGEVVNIEILIEFEEIEDKAKSNINAYLKSNYSKYNYKKIQIQYTGSSDDLEDLIDENEFDEDLSIQYEIEFYGKNNKEDDLFEALFDHHGNLIERRKIKLKATDNLDY